MRTVDEAKVNFDPTTGLVPAVVQDARTSKVLMVGYMNEEALQRSRSEGRVTFFSRSKGRLWTKGETSGHFLSLREILLDCDGDALLVKAEPMGPTCHTGDDTCWGERNVGNETNVLSLLELLEGVLRDRRSRPVSGSYTSSLFEKGIHKVAQKVGEEAVELVIEALRTDDTAFKNEAADLLFHFLMLLTARGIPLSEVVRVLEERRR